MSEVKLIGGADYLKASGLVARGYSKIVLAPADVQGGVQDLIQGVVILAGAFTPVVPASVGASLTASDFLHASGLVARGYSKLVLTPTDVQGGINDIIAALVSLGVTLKADGSAPVQPATIADFAKILGVQ